ncbi:MAG: signal peptidase II [Desulfobacterales bacterium]|jgi:signal peptidase II|nr:signal peptidase II [Desulfobacterales bacterium]
MSNPAEKDMTRHGIARLGIITALIVVLDQITKLIITRTLPLHESIPVIDGFFNLTHVLNPGGAFGVFAQAGPGVRYFFFIGVSLVALGLVFYFYRTTPRSHPVLGAAFALIFSGAVGNLIDRVRFGVVIDFLDFYVKGWHYPAFNVADSAITVGICICVYHFLFNKLP